MIEKILKRLAKVTYPERDISVEKIGKRIFMFKLDTVGCNNYLLDGRYSYDEVIALNNLTGYLCGFGFCKEIGPVAFIGVCNPHFCTNSGYFQYNVHEYGTSRDDSEYYWEVYSDEVAREITEYLKSTDRMQKTIVFCASEDHAERMRIALTNYNQDMVKENPDYCVRITGSDVYGKSKLDYFISVSEPYPVIATTSELLSTGADCKMTKLIVLDKTVESMTTFKQIIGRGTRIREKDGKTHFVVMDFRNVTRLFSDPDWDGPVEQDEGFQHGGSKPEGSGRGGGGGMQPPDDPVETPVVDRDGCKVKIINKTVSVYDANGKLLRQEDIIDYTRTNIKGEYASLSDFIRKWKASDKKKTIEESFTAMGIDLKALKADQGMEDVDDFDFICYVAYGKKPLTRKERANNVKKKDFFSKYSADAQAVLDILLDKYMNQGITEVEDIKVLSLADFANYGKPAKIVKLFGGKAQYETAVRELEASIYEEVEVG